MTTTAATPAVSLSTPLPGTRLERYGWLLPSLLALLMVLFGLQMLLFAPDRDLEITGSMCCNGHRIGEYTGWQFDYLQEISRYLGTYMASTGLLLLVLLVGWVRRGVRGAWYAAWLMPMLFATHAIVLGAFPFDAVTATIASAGLLLMIRPVFRH